MSDTPDLDKARDAARGICKWDESRGLFDDIVDLILKQNEAARREEREHADKLEAVLIDLIDASQDARCADLRVVIARAQAAIRARSTPSGRQAEPVGPKTLEEK